MAVPCDNLNTERGEPMKEMTRGAVAPGKTPVNWRIDTQALEEARIIARERGYASVPQLVSYLLRKVATDIKARKAVFGG